MAAPRSALERNVGDGAAALLIGADRRRGRGRAAALASPTRSSTCGDSTATRSCTRGKTASSSSTAIAHTSGRSGEGPVREDRPQRQGFHQGRALRPGRAQPCGGGARARLRCQDAGAGRALRPPRQHRCRVRADAAGRGARERASPGDTLLARQLRRRRRRASRCASPTRSSGSATAAACAGISSAAPSSATTTSFCAFATSRRASTTAAAAAASRPRSTYRDRNEDISFHGQRCRTLRPGAVPVSARLLQVLRARRLRRGAPVGPHRQGAVAHLRFLRRQPRSAAHRHHDRGRGRRAPLSADDRRRRRKKSKLDLPVEFTFRKIHEYGGTPNYFWKCTPVR